MVLLPACKVGVIPETVNTPPAATPLAGILPTPAAPGAFQATACRFSLPPDIIQGQDINCGYLAVPERRDLPPAQTRLIRLAVAIFHPPGGATQPDPLIFLSGGPGASALEMVRYNFDLFSKIAFSTGRDLVVFDQRGVGVSRPALDCPIHDRLSLDLLDREVDGQLLSDAEISSLILDSIRDCRDALARTADLSAYNSGASAADVRDLRLVLGYEQVNLWAGSYGTRLALEVMRHYPQHLRSVILDAVYPPDVDLYQDSPANVHRALEKLFASCAGNAICNQSYPALETVFFETVERLNTAPAPVEIIDPFSGQRYASQMSGDNLLVLTFRLLYDSKVRYLLPMYIYDASRDNFSAFNLIRGSLIGQIGLSSLGMSLSVQCHEELAFSSLEGFRTALTSYPELAGVYKNSQIGEVIYQVCQEWPAGRAEPSADQPVHSDIPTLVMSGEFDPITPPEWGQRAFATLERSFYYEYPGVGHGASLIEGCPQDMAIAFLKDPLQAPQDACIEAMQAFPGTFVR